MLIKWLTFDSAFNNKQFFIDQLFNFRNAMELVRIRFDAVILLLVASWKIRKRIWNLGY